MTEQQEPSKLLLRLPAHLRQQLEEKADKDYRSLTGEILYLLEYALQAEKSGGGEARA